MNVSTTTSTTTSGTTHGTPWIDDRRVRALALLVEQVGDRQDDDGERTDLTPHTDIAGVCSPARRRVWIAQNVAAANPPMTITASSQPRPTGMFLFITARICSLRIAIVPPSPMINSIAPCRPRK